MTNVKHLAHILKPIVHLKLEMEGLFIENYLQATMTVVLPSQRVQFSYSIPKPSRE